MRPGASPAVRRTSRSCPSTPASSTRGALPLLPPRAAPLERTTGAGSSRARLRRSRRTWILSWRLLSHFAHGPVGAHRAPTGVPTRGHGFEPRLLILAKQLRDLGPGSHADPVEFPGGLL